MAREYTLDTKAAKEANSGSKVITVPDQYIGQFRAAWGEENQNGTASVHLIFTTDTGQESTLRLYTHKGDGTELPSFKTLNAIMVCLKLRGLKPAKGKIRVYDFDSKQDVEKVAECYPDLVGKKIGLVLQAEEYANDKGEIKTRMEIGAPFEASSRRMATEILGSSEKATALDGYLRWFEQNKVKKAKPGSSAPRPASSSQAAHDDFSDDIPF